ncbi:uncharacterized protein LOC114737278 [Neltuma alba]|uniref:uncharacterized protein LOC114737278 n=1 Tax=Neltuma alba TaxID=207710 RepID=UPI0010A55178|nr:uncharacterized protein LOC114737278 [Prosopis alba]
MKLLVDGDSWYDAFIGTADVRDMFSKSGHEEAFKETPTILRPAQQREHSGAEEVWTALLSGTRNGATELVRELLRRKPFAIYDETREKKNIVLVAIEARQSEMLKEVIRHASWTDERLRHGKDVKGNTALHLSAKRSVNPSISVSVVHLQWEVHWFEYVKGLMPAYFMNEPNKEGKTPSMIFEEEHGGMLEESDKWVNNMCGNYMVATTLISSVTFATCFQIPGGYDSQKGTPIVGSTNTAFQLFAISALVSFCFSITSLAAFLAIYSSRSDRYKDYRRALPLKLLVGFFSLFVSIVSMLISFCAAHVFGLYPNHKSKCFPLYLSLTSIPLCFYSATQIPLYWQLLRASFATVPSSRPFCVGHQRPEIDAEEVTERIEEESKAPVTRRKIRMRRPTVERVSFERPRDSS